MLRDCGRTAKGRSSRKTNKSVAAKTRILRLFTSLIAQQFIVLGQQRSRVFFVCKGVLTAASSRSARQLKAQKRNRVGRRLGEETGWKDWFRFGTFQLEHVFDAELFLCRRAASDWRTNLA